MYAERIILMFCAWNLNLKNFNFLIENGQYFFLSVQNASIRIRMPQNACRMNCANVLCRKISKKRFLLHLKGLKLTNYLYLFVMEDPVVSLNFFVKLRESVLWWILCSYEKNVEFWFKQICSWRFLFRGWVIEILNFPLTYLSNIYMYCTMYSMYIYIYTFFTEHCV